MEPIPIQVEIFFQVLRASGIFFLIAISFAGMLFASLDRKQPLFEVMGDGVVTGAAIDRAIVLAARIPDLFSDRDGRSAAPEERN